MVMWLPHWRRACMRSMCMPMGACVRASFDNEESNSSSESCCSRRLGTSPSGAATAAALWMRSAFDVEAAAAAFDLCAAFDVEAAGATVSTTDGPPGSSTGGPAGSTTVGGSVSW